MYYKKSPGYLLINRTLTFVFCGPTWALTCWAIGPDLLIVNRRLSTFRCSMPRCSMSAIGSAKIIQIEDFSVSLFRNLIGPIDYSSVVITICSYCISRELHLTSEIRIFTGTFQDESWMNALNMQYWRLSYCFRLASDIHKHNPINSGTWPQNRAFHQIV